MSSESKELRDIVVFGATGYTGKRISLYIAQIAKSRNLTWSIAGRSEERLKAVLAWIRDQGHATASAGVLVADVKDASSLLKMAESCRVVIAAVGPFDKLGRPVVEACIAAGTDYVDITGEPVFIESLHLDYQARAEAAGSVILPACGGDSLPAELGVALCQELFRPQRLVTSVDAFFQLQPPPGRWLKGNFATLESAVNGFSSQARLKSIRKALNRPKIAPIGAKSRRRTGLFTDPRVQGYCVPFPGSDASVVRATQARSVVANDGSAGEAWPATQFAAYAVIPSRLAAALVVLVGAVFSLLTRFSIGRSLILAYPEVFTLGVFSRTGPDQETLDRSSFSYTFHARGYRSSDGPRATSRRTGPGGDAVLVDGGASPDREVVLRISGPEFGYVATPIFVVESAVTLLRERETIPFRGGVSTPGFALRHSTIAARLQAAGISIAKLSERDAPSSM